MSRHMIIYVHGFNSSPDSIKARLLGEYLAAQHPDIDYRVPALSHWPSEAVASVEALIAEVPDQRVTLVGSSLGGFYSIWLTERYKQCRAVLVNPAIYPHRLLTDWLGENENLYTHERYILTPTHLSQLEALALPCITQHDRFLLLTQTADETLDYREGVDYLSGAEHFVQRGGSHGFDRFEDLMPAIVAFGRGTVALPPATELAASQ